MTTVTRARTYHFWVAGRGAFPVDMLRYDRCTPRTQDDSNEITRSFQRSNYRESLVLNTVALTGPKEPTGERWASFGWSVTGVEKVR